MKNYILTAFVAVAFVLSSCADSSQPSGVDNRPMVSDNKMTNVKTGFERWLYNPCCDEYIHITGTIHLGQDQSGHLRANLSNIVGEGSNGNIYHGGAAESITFDENFNVTSHMLSWVMTSVGGECQFKVKIIFHVVDGEVVVDKFEIECLE